MLQKSSLSGLLFFSVLFLLLQCMGWGQDATGRVVGTVTDPQGAVIAGAKITVTNVDTSVTRQTVTDKDGNYQVLSLPIGNYQVTAEQPGFRKSVSSKEKLQINAALHVDIRMEVGALNETVVVEATTSGVEVVNATVGGSVVGTQIQNAPLNGRNVLDLALFQPGVVPSNVGGAGTFSIGGGRQDSVTFLLDGGVNNNLLNNGVVYNPNPDAVEEFRILTSNYNAEYGRGGGGIISVVSKSGTNAVHGSVYDYLRNDALNANAFFNNANKLPREILKRNQFGASAGGPIVIPKIVNGKDKLFFFVAYQGQRQSALNTTSKITVFTPAELNGDFSLSNSTRTGPDSSVVSFLQDNPYYQPNPSLAARGIIDPTRISGIAKNYIKANMIPTSAAGTLLSQGSAKTDNDELTEKVDYVISQNDRLSVTLGSRRAPSVVPFQYANVPGFPISTTGHQYFGNVSYTKSITSTLLNEFRFTAQRNNNLQSVPAASSPKAADLGIAVTPDNPTGPPNLNFYSGLGIGYSVQGPTSLIDNTYTWSDTLTWIKGKHNIKGGFNYTPYQNNTVYDFYVNGEFSFYSGADSSFTGNDRANFILGLPDEYLQFGEAPSNIRSHNIGFFVQDEWRINRRLTLSFGMRYEYSSPKLDLQNRSFSLGFGQQSSVFTKAPKGLLFPGDSGAPRGANFPDKNDWAPRFGFAFDPKGDAKTSIRGGFGIFYDILKAEDNLQFNGQAPFFGFADLYFDPISGATADPGYFSKPFTAAGQPNPFPSRPPAKNLDFDAAGFLPFGGGGVYFVDPKLRTPYILQYNLSVERELAPNTKLSIAYLGSGSRKLTGLYDANPFVLGTTTRLFNTQPGLPSYAFSYLDQFANVGNANYNALAVGLTKSLSNTRWLGSLMYQFSYTWSKSIDTVSGFRTTSSRVPYYNPGQFRAVSDFDTPQYISFNAQWDLPFNNMWQSGPSRLTKGWSLFPVITYRSGLPQDVRAGISRSRTRTGPSGAGDPNNVRANLVKTVAYYDPHNVQTAGTGSTGNYYFDPTAFSNALFSSPGFDPVKNPSQRTYGTLGRNAFRGPDRSNVNLTVSKRTNIFAERINTEFRAEFFNLFNTAQFGDPNTNITSPQFGQINTTGAPRIIQLALRLTF